MREMKINNEIAEIAGFFAADGSMQRDHIRPDTKYLKSMALFLLIQHISRELLY